MKTVTCLIVVLMVLHGSYAPPVTPDKKNQDSEVKEDLEEYMEYYRYLKEVVQTLESDPDFRERLEKADEDDVRSGKIAEQLDFVNYNVRTKLDEIKRRELERLRHLATKQFELTNNLEMDSRKVPTNEHLDHSNPHTFEIEDLKKLIKKTTADLELADKQRQQQFKEYEMQKEFEKNQKMENMTDPEKKEFIEKEKHEEEAKKHHQPLHHPGSKQQLEEVWEKQDHMDQQFDPKAFFMLHDVDGNGVWDADEVKALFVKELDKMYGPGGPNKDLRERAEEMERMREHVFRENDINRDGLIDFKEFLQETQKAEFNRDEGWKPIDENQIYTQSEYEEFQRRRLEELRYLQQRGLVDAHGRPLPGAEHQIHQAQMAFAQHYQQQQAYQQVHGQPQYYHQGQQVPPLPPQGYQAQPQYQQQYPQGQFQQPPQGQFQQPQGQYQQPQGQQFQAQQPPQGQQYQAQQPPQGQQYQAQQPLQGQQYQAQQPPQGQQYQAQQPLQGQQYQAQQPLQGQQYQAQQPPQGQQYQAQQPPQGQFQQQPPQGQQPPPVQAQNQQPPVAQGQFQAQQPPQAAQGQVPQQPPQGQAHQPPAPNADVNQGQAPPPVAPAAAAAAQPQPPQNQASIH